MDGDDWGSRRGELGGESPAAVEDWVDDGPTIATNPARSPRGRKGRRWARVTGCVVLGLVSLLVLGLTGYAWGQYQNLNSGIKKSDAIAHNDPKSVNGDTNILIMGLDSRKDENGNPLPPDIYNALHAGDSTNGGYNSNVLMLLHVPGNGSRATAISVPRDDYVDFPDKPDGVSKGKIKEAYGDAKDQRERELRAAGVTDQVSLEQQSRDAGRRAEIATVRQFLGGVPIDHFVEVTLVAFFQIAQVVQPITVCVLENTHDTYSGANFHQGQQQINAAQALAFVRQRRDPNVKLNFTDLDRERRQQAFISSLAYQLKQGGTFTDPNKLSQIFSVAKQNVAIDSGLDLLAFAQQASNLTSGNITFFTLPIENFGKDPAGQDVNLVNVPKIQAIVHGLLAAPSTSDSATPTPTTVTGPPPVSGTVDVVNAAARRGVASDVETALEARGFTRGTPTTSTKVLHSSTVYYGPGGSTSADTASQLLGGLPTRSDPNLAAGHLRVVVGSGFEMPTAPGGPSTSSVPVPAPQPANGNNPVSALTAVSGGGIPCVK